MAHNPKNEASAASGHVGHKAVDPSPALQFQCAPQTDAGTVPKTLTERSESLNRERGRTHRAERAQGAGGFGGAPRADSSEVKESRCARQPKDGGGLDKEHKGHEGTGAVKGCERERGQRQSRLAHACLITSIWYLLCCKPMALHRASFQI
eukprot:129439-Rhodomonas_salina.2